MQNTTVQLEIPKRIYEKILSLSKKRKMQPIELIDELVSDEDVSMIAETNTFSYLASIAEDLGVDDLAENHDHYLYGLDKK